MCDADARIKIFLDSIMEECGLIAQFNKMIPADRNLGKTLEHTMLFRSIAVSEQRIGEAASQVLNLTGGLIATKYPSVPWK